MNQAILDYIVEKGQATPFEITEKFSISRQMVHRHLLGLQVEKKIEKRGTAPKVFYIANLSHESKSKTEDERRKFVDESLGGIIEDNFSYISPDGREFLGVVGFIKWCEARKLEIGKTAKQYCSTIKEYNVLVKNNYIDASIKIKNSFKENQNLDSLHYLFFYSLPVFGRTKISNWLFFGKQLQQMSLIDKVLNISVPLIEKFVEKNNIEAVCFVPPSVPRKVQFMKVLEKRLMLKIPKITITKIHTEITIQQKSLKSIEDRIENAEKTMFVVGNELNYKKILILDDFTGSGATLNVLSGKIKKQKIAQEVCGLTITGSVNGFEVVKEV